MGYLYKQEIFKLLKKAESLVLSIIYRVTKYWYGDF